MRDPVSLKQIGRYTLGRAIGRGGMGVVYEAEDDSGRVVALKLMAPELARNPAFRERFTREAALNLEHPNIVPIYEAGAEGDRLFIAMYLVRGGDLKGLIQREGRLLPARAISTIRQAADALDVAHSQGVVHRDVKPSNFLLEVRSEVGAIEKLFLSDFGLVKQVSASETSLTGGAHLVGTAHYMSPEQIKGGPLDGRADVYSLGCVLYECVTGSVPFPSDEEVAVLWAHVNESPTPVSEKVPVLPQALDDVIGKAMSKDPADRFLTAGEFASELESTLGLADRVGRGRWHSLQIPAPRTTSRGESSTQPGSSEGARGARRGWLVGATGLLIAALALFPPGRDTGRTLTDTVVDKLAPIFDGGDSADEPTGNSDGSRKTAPATRVNSKRSGEAGRLDVPPLKPAAITEDVNDPVEDPSPQRKLSVSGPRHPAYGTYAYAQAGYERVCPEGGGTCLDEGGDLPGEQVARVARYGFSEPPLILARTEMSSRLSSRATIEYRPGDALLHEMIISFDTRLADFKVTLTPDPPESWLRFPLTPGSTWSGSWTSRSAPGEFSVEVLKRATTNISGEAVRTYKTHLVLTWEGSHAGAMDVYNWIDPRTGLTLESAGTLRAATGIQRYYYETAFRTLLRQGPGYSP